MCKQNIQGNVDVNTEIVCAKLQALFVILSQQLSVKYKQTGSEQYEVATQFHFQCILCFVYVNEISAIKANFRLCKGKTFH